MQWLDVRSDTVTQPTPAMREAMFAAVVGDDVYGDDPTVAELEALGARMLGKEAALFVPTGNFGNQLALLTHCRRGDEVILGDDCHIVWHETGGAAVIAGVQLRTIESELGVLDPRAIEARIRVGEDIHFPRTGLICLENAHSNGRVIPLDVMAETRRVADRHSVPVHLDGARVFNAATHLGCDVREITQYADSVMCCLSKGLAAPVGSLLAGSRDFIARARRGRKLMGGGMRQAGVIAAPGIVALRQMSGRLAEDHANARALAARLAALPGVWLDEASVQINMVWFRLADSVDVTALMDALADAGVKANPPEDGWMRVVTHWQVSAADVERLADVFEAALTDRA
ncbi:low-specificity L-threonine aldolase [Crenobacter intestini]|uniref:Low-specificity L-threonine aldolase n=1 Tax=Crenobacter intestini TaxID=2563443 RepID=A0A4T0V3B9_9NEIS|nr:low-specificity L-threonine aldolase [Crenobacter intestini]TIC86128.1 low-specificity L-threonine aldolase [Crenobacter intestini]